MLLSVVIEDDLVGKIVVKLFPCDADDIVKIYGAIEQISQLLDLGPEGFLFLLQYLLFPLKLVVFNYRCGKKNYRNGEKRCQHKSYQHLGIGRL